MKRTQCNRIVGAVLALAVPFAALADFSSTATMAANTSLNLTTGVSGTNTGDLLWTGANMMFIGSAKGFNVGALGATAYGGINLALLQAEASLGSASPIAATSMVVGDIFAVQGNTGNYTKAMVTGVSGTSLSFEYTTFGAASTGGGGGTGGGTATVTITGVQNNSSSIPDGFPNSGIPPSSLFKIIGSNLAASGDATLHSSQGSGLSTTLNGASLTVTVGGTTVHPAMYYATPTQIDAVLPASTPSGAATLTVSYNGGTATSTFQVVPSAIGIDLYNGSAVATDASTGALITYTNSARPGETLILWGTGVGADPADSDTTYTSSPHPIGTSVQVYIGGELVPQASVAYVGASVYPGVDVVGFTLPSDVATGCGVSLALVSNGTIVSNVSTLPIGNGVCSDPTYGINGTTISTLSGSTTVRDGSVILIQETMPATTGSGTTTNSIAEASFESVTGASYTSSSGLTSIGSCIVSEASTASLGTLPTEVGLDAGVITMTGPNGTVTLTQEPTIVGTSFAQLSGTTIPANGGTFVFNGAGGKDVGPFTATVNFPNPLSWTNQSAAATVTRGSGLQVTWTGGASGTYVIINGSSASTAGASGSYTCFAPASAQQFTVPSYILLGLPAGTGTTLVENSSNFSMFSASHLDSGIAFGAIATSVKSTYN